MKSEFPEIMSAETRQLAEKLIDNTELLEGLSPPERSRQLHELASLVQEELQTELRETVTADLETAVEDVITTTLVSHDVHKKGLSDQQEAKLHRVLSGVVDRTLDRFKTIPQPNAIDGVTEYEQFLEEL